MSSGWKFNRESTWVHHLREHFYSDIEAGMTLDPNHPQVMVQHLVANHLTRKGNDDLITLVKNILRAPWEVMQFHLINEVTGDPIYKSDGTSYITQDDFKAWVDSNVGTPATVWAMTPSAFLTANPSWTYDGATYSTNFFKPLFEELNQTAVDNANDNTGGLDWAKCLGFEFTIHLVTHDADGNAAVYPMGQNWLQWDNMEHITITALDASTDHSGIDWPPVYRCYVSATSSTFHADVTNFVAFMLYFGTQGLNVPFDMNLLPPHVTGVDLVTFRTDIDFHLCSLWRGADSTRRDITLKVHNPDAKLCKLSFMSFDLSTYRGDDTLLRVSKPHKHGTIHDSEPMDTAMLAYVETQVRITSEMQRDLHWSENDQKDLKADIDVLVPHVKETWGLILHRNNYSLHRSEGFLRLKEIDANTEYILEQMKDRKLSPTTTIETWQADLAQNKNKYNAIKERAIAEAVYKEEYEKRERPLHVKQQEHDDDDRDFMLSVQAQHADPSIPVWAIATMSTLAIILAAAILVYYYKFYKPNNAA